MQVLKAKSVMEIPFDFTGVVEIEKIKYWLVDKRLHRIDGPALETINGYKEYWVYGKRVTKEQQELLFNLMKLKSIVD